MDFSYRMCHINYLSNIWFLILTAYSLTLRQNWNILSLVAIIILALDGMWQLLLHFSALIAYSLHCLREFIWSTCIELITFLLSFLRALLELIWYLAILIYWLLVYLWVNGLLMAKFVHISTHSIRIVIHF
jgi:hypothetical protein